MWVSLTLVYSLTPLIFYRHMSALQIRGFSIGIHNSHRYERITGTTFKPYARCFRTVCQNIMHRSISRDDLEFFHLVFSFDIYHSKLYTCRTSYLLQSKSCIIVYINRIRFPCPIMAIYSIQCLNSFPFPKMKVMGKIINQTIGVSNATPNALLLIFAIDYE